MEYFIQVFLNGLNNEPTLKYKVKNYSLEEGMLHFIDPKTNLPKSFPTSICIIDGVEK